MADSPHPIPDGARVRHTGHQWPEAFDNGTGTVLGHFYAGGNPSHLEYRVKTDPGQFIGADRETEWASYHTHPVTVETVTKPLGAADCTCVFSCADHPPTACSLSGEWHVHPDDGSGTFGPCPVHPSAPGDLR